MSVKLKVAACVPVVRVADVRYNLDRIVALATEAAGNGAKVIFFPKDALVGATAGTLAGMKLIRRQAASAKRRISSLESRLGVVIEFGSADPALVTSYGKRRASLLELTARRHSSAVYCNAGYGESTTDFVYDGAVLICEDGKVLAEAARFQTEEHVAYAELSLPLLDQEAISSISSAGPSASVNPHPFVPSDQEELNARCEEILNIQAMGLMTRMTHISCRNAVLGISGGLDSTLALLVCCRAFDRLGLDRKGILAVTMPGFGTSDRTHDNALSLMDILGVTVREISIAASVLQHLSDIGHDKDDHNVTYENAQARERTQILMDLANECNGIVVGTGDLSELALGWCTYNGDHMSMYGVNAGVPKTLMQAMVRRAAVEQFPEAGAVLNDIADTPISPELLPGVQPTEDLVGPYELHDFFLYRLVRLGETPREILDAAASVFSDRYGSDVLEKWLRKFLWRFFSQQFKRSCAPDGAAVGSVSLSPRSGFRFASDVDASVWVADLD